MHIAVDGTIWGNEPRGVALATRRLWTAYAPRAGRATVFASSSAAPAIPASSVVPVGPLAGARRLAWQQCVLPLELRRREIDLLHCPVYTVPLAAAGRLVVTVHDLIAWTHPRLAGWRNALHLRALIPAAVERADAVCAPTQAVRRAILERFAVSPRKVFVVPWGADAEIAPLPRDEAAARVLERFGVGEPFALFCGCVEAKKNAGTAIRAAEDAGLLLLLAGPLVEQSPAILRASGGRTRYLGYVTAAELGALYSAAVALLFPSFVEGFGLPAVEAMRCGCPVLASNDPALREVCGGAALHADASDAGAFAAYLRRVRHEPTRAELAARGRERAAAFTWPGAAERFAEAIHYATSN